MTESSELLNVHDVNCHYGPLHVLRGISFELGRGEGVVLLGANGCGKSTLMRCLNGLERVTSGTISLDGTDVVGARGEPLRTARRRMGYVFQQFNLVPQLSAFQNVLFGRMGHYRAGILRCLKTTASQADRLEAMDCLERVGLADRAEHRPQHLSGGQQQRVAIARMLMQRPTLVVADEPIASLDPKAGREVLDLLWRIVDEDGLSLLCTLHQLDLAREYGRRLIGMKAGQVVLDGPTSVIAPEQLDGLYGADARVDSVPSQGFAQAS